MGASRDVVEDACAILRAHGINAHEQGGDVVIFAASSSHWTPIAAYNLDGTKEEIAVAVAAKVAALVIGPHTHEVVT